MFRTAKIICCVILIPLSIFAKEENNSEVKLKSPENVVTSVCECNEFKVNATKYNKKAKTDSVFAKKYMRLAEDFNIMYEDCMKNIESNASYDGYRPNAIQREALLIPVSLKTKPVEPKSQE